MIQQSRLLISRKIQKYTCNSLFELEYWWIHRHSQRATILYWFQSAPWLQKCTLKLSISSTCFASEYRFALCSRFSSIRAASCWSGLIFQLLCTWVRKLMAASLLTNNCQLIEHGNAWPRNSIADDVITASNRQLLTLATHGAAFSLVKCSAWWVTPVRVHMINISAGNSRTVNF